VELSPLGSGDDHIHSPAAALGADKPLAPIENRRIRAISSSRLGRVGLDLVAAIAAPYDSYRRGKWVALFASVAGSNAEDPVSTPCRHLDGFLHHPTR
jgi:hypothetical protein